MYEKETKELTKLAEAVCPYLAGNWGVNKDYEGHGVVIREGQKQLYFSFAWNNHDRLIISGSWPNGLSQFIPYASNRPKTEITVAKDKTPEKIAQDITKRLLPNYEQVLIKVLERKKIEDTYQANKKAALEKVVEAIGGDAKLMAHNQVVISYKPYDCTVEYRSGDSIKLEINLPLDKAIEILKGL